MSKKGETQRAHPAPEAAAPDSRCLGTARERPPRARERRTIAGRAEENAPMPGS